MKLWVDNGGAVYCEVHGGNYLAAAVAAYPRRRRHSTPLAVWERFDEPGWECESCSQITG